MNKEILLLLQQGYSLLTPTMRLGRFLKSQYAEKQLASGQNTWESPDIIPWQSWLYRCWDEYSSLGEIKLFRLSPWQQQSIWLDIIQKSDFSNNILQPQNVARQAVQAWELTHQWQMPLYPDDIFITHDVRAFQSWAHSFQHRCQVENWIDDARLPDILIKPLLATPMKTKLKIALVGFESVLPQQKTFLTALSDAGNEVRMVELAEQNQQVVTAGFNDEKDEIDAAANWVRQKLLSNTRQTIGIVVPNLRKLRSQVHAQFDDILRAEDILSSAEPSHRPYSISLGQGLNKYPLIAAAFSILALEEYPFPVSELGILLRSPFIRGAVEEKAGRALLDAHLREYGEQYISFSMLAHIADTCLETEQSAIFLECLSDWQTIRKELPARQAARDWSRAVSKLLKVFTWPGERSPDSAEYQTIQAWQELLVRFVSLDVVNSPVSFRTALSQLKQLASAFSFQPESAEVPVQVMGVEGAAGMQFDQLWIMGLHEDAWPLPAEPNPFVPLSLQRQYQVPAGSADNQLAYSRHVTACLVNSSANVVLSYPQNEDERELRASPLLKPFTQGIQRFELDRLTLFNSLIFDSADVEYLNDDLAPEIQPGQRVRGGAGLFKDQAACPFRAFARHRLHGHSLSEVDIGLDAMERGSLLHDLMQSVWTKIGSQAALLKMSVAEEKKTIVDSIDATFNDYQKQKPVTFTGKFIELENKRLLSLVLEWLNIEKSRQDFKVNACELKHNFVFNDIEVHTRIDRIDDLNDGRQVIIDYKTGEVSVKAWFDERPDDPQLPLYAITSNTEIAAIAFAKLKNGESNFTGLANGNDVLPAVRNIDSTPYVDEFENWSGLLKGWERVMTGIAEDFRLGKAAVMPKNSSSCRYCDLHAFCRIYELTAGQAEQRGQENE